MRNQSKNKRLEYEEIDLFSPLVSVLQADSEPGSASEKTIHQALPAEIDGIKVIRFPELEALENLNAIRTIVMMKG